MITIRVVICIYIYIYFHPCDVSIRRDARSGRWHTEESRRHWTNFYFVLSLLFITDGSNSRDGRSKVFAARSAVAAKYRAKSLTKNRWGRRVGPAIKFAKRILVRRGNHSDGDVIDLKPTLWTRGWKINPSWINENYLKKWRKNQPTDINVI